MTTVELVQGYAAGTVSNEALIWKAGMEEWQSPFDIPALALALQARGFARPAVVPTAQKEPRPSETPPPPTTDASDWEGDDAPTRVADATLRFPGRPIRPGAEPQKPDAVNVEQHWEEEDDEETVALGGDTSAKNEAGDARLADDAKTDAPPPGPVTTPAKAPVDFDDEATEIIAPDRARELLAAESDRGRTLPPPPGARPAPFDEEESTEIIAEDRAEALLAARSARPSDAPPGLSPPVANVPGPPRPPAVPSRSFPRTASGSLAPPLPSRAPRQPPRPRPLTAEASTPLDVNGVPPVVEKPMIPTPKPAAGMPPLASLAPPKPSSAPPPEPKPVPPIEPVRPAEPTIVVAETKPRPPEAALRTLPRQNPPSPPAQSLRTMQNEPTRVVRVVSKSPGVTFWVVLLIALAAAAAGGFVVSQMLRDRGAPSWLKKP
ncbi:MAG TPA: DUF4339 domain-containing protein [Polyangiaceae bacterium]|jgi:hypothetical protein|nr:DUF4339 domain-containing protein [Polyangiaceae bacterium]